MISLTAMPCERAKPSAALVGLPFASNAAFTDGPIASSSESACRSATFDAATTSRRGVPAVRITPWLSRAASSSRPSACANCSSAGAMYPAGISSAPIS